jgi:hypothetical protein
MPRSFPHLVTFPSKRTNCYNLDLDRRFGSHAWKPVLVRLKPALLNLARVPNRAPIKDPRCPSVGPLVRCGKLDSGSRRLSCVLVRHHNPVGAFTSCNYVECELPYNALQKRAVPLLRCKFAGNAPVRLSTLSLSLFIDPLVKEWNAVASITKSQSFVSRSQAFVFRSSYFRF